MNNIYFKNVINIGDLYLDHVFFKFEKEPILFLCSDKLKKLYLCLCSEIRYEQKWIVTQIDIATIKSLLKEKLDIYSVFKLSKKLTVINMNIHGDEKSSEISIKDVDPLDLPKEGIFVKCNIEKAKNYLWKKELEIMVSQMTSIMCKHINIYDINMSYELSFLESIKIFEQYKESLNKTFISKYEKKKNILKEQKQIYYESSFSLNDKETFNYEHLITPEEKKYMERIEEWNVNKSVKDDYLHAA